MDSIAIEWISTPNGVARVPVKSGNVTNLSSFSPGETVEVNWKVRVIQEIKNQDISVQVRGIVSSSDPYTYSDVIGIKGTTNITFTKSKVLV